MDINSLTIGQAKELASLFSAGNNNQDCPFEVGKQYFIRTVTNYYVGSCESIGSQSIRLTNASWVPDTGRFNVSQRTGVFKEVEPYVDGVTVWFGGIIDHSPYSGDLPTEQK
jgi:hypothetical protein